MNTMRQFGREMEKYGNVWIRLVLEIENIAPTTPI